MYLEKEKFSNERISGPYVYRALEAHPSFTVHYNCTEDIRPAEFSDIIFCRFEIPVKRNFLERLSMYDTPERSFINPPLVKMKYHTKEYLEEFIGSEFLPETMISSSSVEMLNLMYSGFSSRWVIKPLDENGGKGVSLIDIEKMPCNEIEKMILECSKGGKKRIISQEYITNVETYGDKRINLLFYEPVSAVLRLPQEGSFICNTSQGASRHKAEITDSDRNIIDAITPFLKKHRILWAGIDIIGPYLGEINVSSPGLLWRADNLNENTKGVDFLVQKLSEL